MRTHGELGVEKGCQTRRGVRAEQRVQGGCGVPGGEKLPDRVRSEAWGCGQTQVVEQFLGTVLCGPQLEKLRVLIDELGIHGA